ncbi:hypothetical protein G4B88_029021 [Cannabis sativa]|uniref:DUF1985 domain-containing protein n=1 Tax=Cannabis sativa TaxID=3483 RepID=A0A7J6HN63_CANSA|nr:hypothetical protein G4B88_029021 [Cannabis sativa]
MHINIGNHFPTSPLCLLLHLHTIFPLHLSSPLSFSGDASSKTHFYHFRLLPSSIIFFSGSYDEKVACKKIIEKKALKGFQDLKLQALLVHHIMLREVYSMSEDVDFWFKINGTMVRFSIEEFSLITELKCHGNDDKSIFVEKDES